MNFDKLHRVLFLGVGGIGMSALARYFKSLDIQVFGYDKTETTLTQQLQKEGIEVVFEDNLEWLSTILSSANQSNFLAIYTPAVPPDLKLKTALEQSGLPFMKRAKALGLITQNSLNLSVAGTHGKTTTSTLLAHILNEAGVPSVAFLGGISSNFNSNYHNTIIPAKPVISITEADEFDRSFLHLSPKYAVITSVDADHLDIYGSADEMLKSFQAFGERVNPDGLLLVHHSIKHHFERATTYGINYGHYSAQNVHINDGKFVFDLVYENEIFRLLTLGMAGIHNVENAVAASVLALKMGISENDLRKALANFKGVKRRFEFIVRNEKHIYIDDYAHHPTELKAAIGSAKKLFPNKKITGVFQPHLYSRTRDFQEGFAESLSMLDEVILMDIYPARELPIEGITSQIIFDKITAQDKKIWTPTQILDSVQNNPREVLLTLGAGDIDRLIEPIKTILKP
ncbi:MAG: UDP-N-acetylmuramate--L-alanine ligase [Flavobacteriales bacterium]|nr:UDP-N-acetylmuramate--L-alanine ligase [Flavobacteriales bacterium]